MEFTVGFIVLFRRIFSMARWDFCIRFPSAVSLLCSLHIPMGNYPFSLVRTGIIVHRLWLLLVLGIVYSLWTPSFPASQCSLLPTFYGERWLVFHLLTGIFGGLFSALLPAMIKNGVKTTFDVGELLFGSALSGFAVSFFGFFFTVNLALDRMREHCGQQPGLATMLLSLFLMLFACVDALIFSFIWNVEGEKKITKQRTYAEML
jgi:hypothetical protein